MRKRQYQRKQHQRWTVKTLLKEIVIVGLLVLIVSNVVSYMRKPTLESTQLPSIEVRLLDGSWFHVVEGQPLIVHFWAVWCPTCKFEATNIEAVSKAYNVITIAVNSGSDEKVENYMKERGLSFKVLNDEKGKWVKQFNVEAFPTTFIYDAKGVLRFTEVGYTTTAGFLARLKWIQ